MTAFNLVRSPKIKLYFLFGLVAKCKIMTRVIAVYNQKGGVAKTTTCVNLAAYLSLAGRKVLLVDFDPQANASSGLGFPPKTAEQSVYHGIFDLAKAEDLIKPTALYNYHLIPSSQHLAGALVELVNLSNREHYLKNFINKIKGGYDYVLIDLPPSLSLLTINGLVAAKEILIPVQAEYLSLEGLSQILEVIDMINKNISPDLTICGAVLTMYDEKQELSRQIEKSVKDYFSHHIFESKIPRSAALAEAPSFARPIVLYHPMSDGAKAYENLAKEIIEQELGIKNNE